jgi:hypothetical protein
MDTFEVTQTKPKRPARSLPEVFPWVCSCLNGELFDQSLKRELADEGLGAFLILPHLLQGSYPMLVSPLLFAWRLLFSGGRALCCLLCLRLPLGYVLFFKRLGNPLPHFQLSLCLQCLFVTKVYNALQDLLPSGVLALAWFALSAWFVLLPLGACCSRH